jgi:hypothetical protein
LNEQVKRNRDRFPPDFMFRLTRAEKDEVVAKCDHLDQLEAKYDQQFAVVFDAIRDLMDDQEQRKRRKPISYLTEAKPKKNGIMRL